MRLLPSGAVDGGFRPPITRYSAVAFAAGAVYAADDEQRRLLKLDPLTGDPDPAFAPIGYSQSIGALVAAAQDLYLFGSFQLSGIVPALGRFARMRLATGSIDDGFRFTPNGGGTIAGVALDPAATRILLVGNFTAINGQAATQLAKIDAQTLALDAGFQPAIVGPVSAATLDGDGGVWINGAFSSVAGQTCRTPARLLLESAGALDPAFSCNRAAQGNGALLFDRDGVYGAFGSVLRRYARADGGSPDPAWQVSGSAGGVRLLIADARLLVHGSFDTFAGVPRRALAAVPLATAVFGNGFE